MVWSRAGTLERTIRPYQAEPKEPFEIQVVTIEENFSFVYVTMMCGANNVAHEGALTVS